MYPILLLVNAAFFIFWLIRLRRQLFLSLIVILIGYGPIGRYIQFTPGKKAPDSEKLLKVLSYNVQNMSHSNFGHGGEDIRDHIYGFIRSEEAGIVCLQEFSAKQADIGHAFSDLLSHTGHKYYHYANYSPRRSSRLYALVILSDQTYITSGSLSLPGDDHHFGLFIDLPLFGDTVRIFNLHLESIRLEHEDYQFVEDVSKGQTEKGTLREGSRSVLSKLHHAYQVRARQAKRVRQSIDTSPYPVIICGDFNDTPLSYAYNHISSGLEDSFVGAGYGRGNTFEGKLPSLRIDYILHSKELIPYEFRVHHSDLSDHYALTVYFGK